MPPHPETTQVLPVGRFLVLALASKPEPMAAREVLGPRCYTAGAGRALDNLVPDSGNAQIWVLEWPSGLVAVVCLPIGQAPDPQLVFDASADVMPQKWSLATTEPANELAC